MQRELGRFGRGVAKGVVTVLMFSCVPQAADPLGEQIGPTWEVFADVAPEATGFRVGVVGKKRFYWSLRCPPCINSPQRAELFVVYVVAKLATCRGFTHVWIGFDSNVARLQINSLRALVGSVSQQCILRRLFWLRCWSGTSISSFRAWSAINPVDPLSREVCCQSRRHAILEAKHRRLMWEKATDDGYIGQVYWSGGHDPNPLAFPCMGRGGGGVREWE